AQIFRVLPFPFLHIAAGGGGLRVLAVVVLKCPAPYGLVGKAPAFQFLYGVKVAAAFLGGLPFLPDFPLAVALCRVAVTPEQRLSLREIGFFGLAAFAAVQQTVLAGVV